MKIDIDEIGRLYNPASFDANGVQTAQPQLIAGWQINTTHAVHAWASKKVTPATPRRMFAGVTTHFYTFADEAEYLSMSNGVDLTVPVPRYVPAEVQMRQARLALMRAGKLAAVETALTAMTGVTGEAARIEWQYSNTIKRNQPLVLSLGAVLGLTPTQLDDLFLLAESI